MAGIAVKLTKLNWIEAVFYPLTVMLAEVLWLHPWLIWAAVKPDLERTPLSLLSLFVIIGIAFFITRVFPQRRRIFLWIQIAVLLLVILAVIRVEYGAGYPLMSVAWFADIMPVILDSFSHLAPIGFALVAAIYLSWRGISLGRSHLLFADVARYFLIGLVAVVSLIVVWRASLGVGSLESLASAVGLQVVGFFFFGLFALAMGNLQDIRKKMADRDRAQASIRRWIPIQAGVVGGIILLGIGVASIFSSALVAVLGRLLSTLWNFIAQMFFYLLLPFDWLGRVFAMVVEWLVSLLQGGRPPEPFVVPEFFEPGEMPAVSQAVFPEAAITALKWGLFLVVATIVLLILVKTLSRLRSVRAEDDIEEIQESLWSWDGLKMDLRLFLNTLMQRFRRKRQRPIPAAVIPDWFLHEETEGGLDVREIYRRLLWETSSYGIGRYDNETPGEYARRLGEAVPESGDRLNELTGLYLSNRYGERKVGKRQENKANRLWKGLHGLFRGHAP